jgi:hypothetical protein
MSFCGQAEVALDPLDPYNGFGRGGSKEPLLPLPLRDKSAISILLTKPGRSRILNMIICTRNDLLADRGN